MALADELGKVQTTGNHWNHLLQLLFFFKTVLVARMPVKIFKLKGAEDPKYIISFLQSTYAKNPKMPSSL